MLLSLIDITAAKESELKLHESEEKNRLLIDNAAEGIVVVQDGLLKFVNPKSAEITGWSVEELVSMSFLDLVHPEDRRLIADNHRKRMAGEDTPNNYVCRIIDRHGTTKWIQINAVRFDWEGQPATLTMLADITERVQAQEALAASEANYRDLFEHTMVGMEVVDTETMKVVLANHSMARMFGFKSPEEMVGTEPLSYVLPEDLDWVVAELGKALSDPKMKETATLRVRTQDGRIIWVTGMTTRFQYVFRPSILISLVDVTAVKEADLKLQESEEKNRLLIDNAAEAIVVVQDGMTKFFNRRLAELTGWPPEQLFAKSFLDLVHPDDRELIALNYMKRVGGEDIPNNYQFRIIDSQNNTRWFQVNAVRLNWEGKPATMTMFGDVTERVKAEQAVRDSEERFRALIEKATDAIAIIDAQGKIIYYSPSIERATGYESQGWLSRSMPDWKLHPDDLAALAPVFDEILKNPGKIIEGLKVRYEHTDGTWHTLEATVRNLLHDPKINGLVANFRDVTERVKGEELLRNSEERFRGLVETSSDWVWEVDRNSQVHLRQPQSARYPGI